MMKRIQVLHGVDCAGVMLCHSDPHSGLKDYFPAVVGAAGGQPLVVGPPRSCFG